MKRYLLFWNPNYDAGGGWNDFKGAFDTIEDALLSPPLSGVDWQIVDTTTMTIIKSGVN